MKKSILIIGIIVSSLLCGNAYAQNMWDAYRLSQQFNEGTARSVSMGNAVVALGGDMGALSINPAGSAVYRYNEFVVTPELTTANSNVIYLGNNQKDNRTKFGVSNFGYVHSFNTGRNGYGLVNWSFALAYNKTNNYTSRMSATGKTAESSWLAGLAQYTNGIYAPNMDMNSHNDPFYNSGAPWTSILGWNTTLLDTLPDSDSYYIGATENIVGTNIVPGGELQQSYYKETSGNNAEIILNWGGNIANKLFIGVNLGVTSIWYRHSETYMEKASNPSQFQTGFTSFKYNYNYTTAGTGFNLKAGVIYLPFKGMRLGASVSTPTWMYLNDEYEEIMESNFSDGYSQRLLSPLGTYNYRLNTPFRWNLGAAYTFKQRAAISVDYENANYSKMKLVDDSYSAAFNEENDQIRKAFKSSHIVRAGAEVKINPSLALRAGYQFYTSGNKYESQNINIGSLGFGYASPSGFFADLAYQQQLQKSTEEFQLYDDIVDETNAIITAAPVGMKQHGIWRLLLSVGLRF